MLTTTFVLISVHGFVGKKNWIGLDNEDLGEILYFNLIRIDQVNLTSQKGNSAGGSHMA